MTYKYIAPVNITLSLNTLKDIVLFSRVPPTLKTWPDEIVRQLYTLSKNNTKLNFPVTLVDRFETAIITEEIFNQAAEHVTLLEQRSNIKVQSIYGRQPFPLELNNRLINELPECLKKLGPIPVIQTINVPGDGLAPHVDHYRSVSLYYLLEGEDDWDTVWYSHPTPPDKHKFGNWNWNWGELDSQEALRFRIKKHKWYVFDNSEFHSVIGLGNHAKRVAINIEFKNNVTASELYQLIVDSKSLK